MLNQCPEYQCVKNIISKKKKSFRKFKKFQYDSREKVQCFKKKLNGACGSLRKARLILDKFDESIVNQKNLTYTQENDCVNKNERNYCDM